MNPRLYKWGFSPVAAFLVFLYAQTAAKTLAYAARFLIIGPLGAGIGFLVVGAAMVAAPLFIVEFLVRLTRRSKATAQEHAWRALAFRRGTAIGLVAGALLLFAQPGFSQGEKGIGAAACLAVTAAAFYAVNVLDARRVSNEL
jgi:hypothetical protein